MPERVLCLCVQHDISCLSPEAAQLRKQLQQEREHQQRLERELLQLKEAVCKLGSGASGDRVSPTDTTSSVTMTGGSLLCPCRFRCLCIVLGAVCALCLVLSVHCAWCCRRAARQCESYLGVTVLFVADVRRRRLKQRHD